MRTKLSKPLTAAAKVLVVLSLVLAASSSSPAQMLPSTPIVADQGSTEESRSYNSLDEERRVKREIEAAEKAHKQNLTRARDLAFLSASLYKDSKGKKHLDRAEMKSLEKAEKLAKSIRDASGGSNEEVELPEPPTDLASALCRFSELAESLKLKVEKTPKRVISAAVIDEANVLLELIRIIRAMQPKA
jgi:hypothetical protein